MRRTLPLILALGACSSESEQAANAVLPQGPSTNISEVSAAALPADLAALVQRSVPGMTVDEAERKEREGRVYYDIEGKRPDGSAVELDVLQEGGAWRLVEIQRDVAWKDAPATVLAAAKATKDAFEPERVIESTQTDGAVIYELFAPGREAEPAMEIRLRGGKAEVLGERWAH
jgi:hypothetical protein